MQRFAVLAFAALAAGCTTTEQAANFLQRQYAGQNLDAFVLKHGAPYKKHQLNSGDVMYAWSSEIRTYAMPTMTTFQGTAAPGGAVTGSAFTTGGGGASVFCEVTIVTRPDGTIKAIDPSYDTIGRWTTSRCAEIFKE